MDLDTEINVGDGDVDDLEEEVYDLEGVDDLEEDVDMEEDGRRCRYGVDDLDELETITPKVDMEFLSLDDAYHFYNRYALKMGFGIRKYTTHHSRTDKTLLLAQKFVCRMQGKKKVLNEDVGSSRRDIRVGCNAMMKITRTESNNWKVSLFESEHINHEMSTPSKVVKHFSHKKAHRQKSTKNLITHFHEQGLTNTNISKVINSLQRNPDNPEDDVSPQQVHNCLRVERKNNMGKHCAKVIKHFIEKKAKDPHFYSSIEVDDDMTLRSIFWADGRSREAYKQFNDVIVFDVTYRTNNLCLPFAPFTGINHHRQSCLLGCALLADETEKTFVWLFQQYLECMGGEAPRAIITDQDAAIGNTIAIVFPANVHRYCDWHLDKNIGEHMVSLKAVHGPEFELYFNRLRTSSSEGEAESTWKELMTRYKLENNSWLPRLWVHRAHWVHCYFIDTFFAGTRTSQRSESINFFFDKFVHASTPLHEFVLQYDKALASRRKAEEDEDFKSMESKPVPISGWPLEVQAGRCYTRALFSLFKKEMSDARQVYWADRGRKEGDITIFSVERVGTNESTGRTVSYNSDEGVVSCSCKHFEFVGLLCRHVLCVFWMNRVSEIPERYILKRWTLEARYRSVVVDMGDDVGVSELDRNRHLSIRYKCNKAVELAFKSPNFAEELDRYLTRKFAEYEKPEIPERVDEPSQASNNQVETSHLTPLINIRDPTGPARHKGRPRLPSRTKSGLEESQEESAKKKRKCGYCGEMGHYRTGCSKAKADNVVEDGSQALLFGKNVSYPANKSYC